MDHVTWTIYIRLHEKYPDLRMLNSPKQFDEFRHSSYYKVRDFVRAKIELPEFSEGVELLITCFSRVFYIGYKKDGKLIEVEYIEGVKQTFLDGWL